MRSWRRFSPRGPAMCCSNFSQKTSTKKPQKAPESAAWMNNLMSSIWPIVNPALFNSVADMLEDVMQGSLPKLVKGVRVADFGQGNESMRILGVRWLEAGDAAEDKHGMSGEEGDFANFEIAVAYRARPGKQSASSGGLRRRSQNAHLLIEFWTAGGLRLPVWVEVKGFLATMRVRFQLTPNPPFLSLATITFLGQPKVKVSCVPMAKNFLNVMDLPFVDTYLQKSIDEAVGMYVAPRSLTLDLKTLLTGREKMDTEAIGTLYVRVISSVSFKDGDGGKQWLPASHKRGDPYVTVGWGKYGKALWTTRYFVLDSRKVRMVLTISRILNNEGDPVWDETNFVLVSPADINADENLRLQLWDSDRSTADDLLGVVEVPLRELMTNEATRNQITSRADDMKDYEGKPCPGELRWDVGYFEKTSLDETLKDCHNVEETEAHIEAQAEGKLREAKGTGEENELEQQKKEDLKERTDEIIAGSPPNDEWPSGILYMKVEQITGLEVEHIKESGLRDGPETEGGDDLPSSYCTFILNHQRIYKTRTKLKDNKPFFDAGTERFIRDFRNTSILISVHDERPHESDALLGVVVVPVHHIFSTRSQITTAYPLTGGIGYGRLRLSLSFRSVRLSLPPNLLGWNTGTLELQPHATCSNLPSEFTNCRLVFRTLYAKRKLFPDSSSSGTWDRKGSDRPLRLAVCKRYGSCLLVQFRKYSVGPDTTAAFAVLWFKDIADDVETPVTLGVYKNTDKAMRRAVSNTVDGPGDKIGELSLTLQFYPGLSGYHQTLASSDKDLSKVMAVLDAVEDAKEQTEGVSSASTSESDSSDSDSDISRHRQEDSDDDGKRGLKDELKEYKKNKKDLHRRHRGLMQWSGARKVAWMGRGVKEKGHELGQSVKGKFKGGGLKREKVEHEV